ncbi:hypothetical protein PIROE2DRAFT_12846 [Piromyces sp. E2]|nr:hypothetical protein PIROE2DRAFT_12846 [Piromyces sp. E2]|eukprot:OUM61222.1 hypothetical protein PIROE2DRAFT_12846 [Piromyces sp. E2]
MRIFNYFIVLSSIVFSTVLSYTISYNTTYPLDIIKRQEEQDKDQQQQQQQQSNLYYYYNQLHSYEKAIYDELREQIEKGLETGDHLYDFEIYDIKLHDPSDASLAGFRATSAFVMDNPKYFWIGRGNQQSITTLDSIIKELTISFKRSYEEKELINMLNKVNGNISGLIAELNTLPSTCHKLQRIHDYLIKTVEYQFGEEYSRYNLYGALVEHASVCEGYAEAFTYICQLIGIPSVVVNSKSHEWNLVQMDNGKWYAMDVTYDDPKINNIEFKSGDDKNKKYDYFLIGQNSEITNDNVRMPYSQSEEHKILDYLLVEDSVGFTFPEIAMEAYDCPIKKSTNYIYDYYIPNKMLYIYIFIGVIALIFVMFVVSCIRSRISKEEKRRRSSQVTTPVFSA